MANGDENVRRTLHFRFTLPGVDPSQFMGFLKALSPYYEFFGGAKVRFLQNTDDPSRFIQVVEYEMPESVETNRQRIASDVRVQAYLQAWRTMVPGAVEIDVYREVEGG